MPDARLTTLTAAADRLLNVNEVPDYPSAHNGLQLENRSGRVTRIAAAVDSHLGVIEKAVEAAADLLIVHHGLFWNPPTPLTGTAFAKFRLALENGLAVYSAHLPLDAHPRLGNNALLARRLGLRSPRPFLPYQGYPIGRQFAVRLSLGALIKKLAPALGVGPEALHVMAHGPRQVRRLGICSGGGGSSVGQAVAEGVDTFITGEGPQHTYGLARELGVNLIYAGHYATETLGVQALATHLARKANLPWQFIDEPTGL